MYERDLTKIHDHLMFPEGHSGVDIHNWKTCPNEHEKCVSHCSSIDKAEELNQLLKRAPRSSCAQMLSRKGILIGRLDTQNLKLAESYVEMYVRTCFQ